MKLVLALGIPLIIILPTLILVSSLLKDIKDEKREEVKLVFNRFELGFDLFINLIFFIGGLIPIAMIIYGVYTNDTTIFIISAVTFPLFFLVFNLPLQISHVLHERKQDIFYHKTSNTLTVKKGKETSSFDLNSSSTQLTHYEARIKGRGDKAPGAPYGKISLTNEKSSAVISSYLLSQQFNENILKLLSDSSVKKIRKQFNFL